MRVFEELIRVCKEHGKEFLLLPYVKKLPKLMPLDAMRVEQLVQVHTELVAILKKRERFEDLSDTIRSLFALLAARDPTEVASQLGTCYACLTHLILNDEKLFEVEDFLLNPLVQRFFVGKEALKRSWERFVQGDLESAPEFFAQNGKWLQEAGVSLDEVKDKMRYYRVAQIADKHKKMTVEELAKQLALEVENVEFFLIKAIQYGYVDALIDQMSREVYFRGVNIRNLQHTNKKEICDKLDKILLTFDNFKAQQTCSVKTN